MKRVLIPCIALSALLFACNSPESTSTTTDSAVTENTADTTTMVHNEEMRSDSADNSEDFITDAAAGSMMEVRLGELAKTNAASKAVKDFAAMMVTDHSKASDELKAIAAKNNVAIPATLPDKTQKHIDDLSKKNGAEFDKDYISLMVEDHEDDIKMFERCAKKDDEKADVKAFAAKSLPTLYKHLEASKKIKDAQDK